MPTPSPAVDRPCMIECREVEKAYGSSRARTVALDRVDLCVPTGEILAIVGPSGSGKSTLLHLVGAMDTPDRGEVVVAGRALSQLDDLEASRFRRDRVGFVFQFFNLIPAVSALDNVAFPARLAGEHAESARERARGLLERVGLGDRVDDHPDTLSGGQQQRVAIARALVNDPGLILADEPTGALDRRTSDDILKLLTGVVAERGVTLVMATHSEAASASAHRVVAMEDGRIVA